MSAVIEQDPNTTLPLEDRSRRPFTVEQVNTIAVTPRLVSVQISGTINIDASDQALMEAAVKEEIDSVRPFRGGVDNPNFRNDVLSVNRLIFVAQSAISSDQRFSDLTFDVDSVNIPTEIQFLDGDIPSLLSISFS